VTILDQCLLALEILFLYFFSYLSFEECHVCVHYLEYHRCYPCIKHG
jgi:hypothetical protein